jgi:putative transcriptional regulator
MAHLPTHHPAEDLLLEYASGTQREPVALLIATHLALCPECRARIRSLEAIGGALVEQLGPEPVAQNSFARLLARLDQPEPAAEPQRPAPGAGDRPGLPQPLRDYVGGSLDRLKWHRLGPIAETRLLRDFPGFTTRLVRLRAGTGAPAHTHGGTELTLVLEGGFKDASGHYLRGDVEYADAAVDHRPVADADGDCLCLAVVDAPVRLTGRFGRLINPFLPR